MRARRAIPVARGAVGLSECRITVAGAFGDCQAVEAAWKNGNVPINAAEGFISPDHRLFWRGNSCRGESYFPGRARLHGAEQPETQTKIPFSALPCRSIGVPKPACVAWLKRWAKPGTRPMRITSSG